MAKKQIRDYVFKPGLSGLGQLKILDKVTADQILLISNATRNVVLYNFSDATNQIHVEFDETTVNLDPDFPYANASSNGVTAITFLFDTSTYSATDKIQLFVESSEVTTRPYDFGTDAIERMRMAAPQSMLDADFEYGIQPTKWQTIDLMRGYPSTFEYPGADIEVSAIITDASQGTGGIGPSLITVDTILDHGFTLGNPITLKGVSDSVPGFSKAEGSFVISTVPSANQFTFYAKGKVGISPATSLLSSFIQLRKAGFYTGAALPTPTLSVASNGASGQLTSRGITLGSSDRIGIISPGSPPPVGAPISGGNIAAGTQITGYVPTNIAVAITSSFTAPVSNITLNDTAGIEIGAALDDGTGKCIFVTNIEQNTISLSGTYKVNRTGNSFISQPTAAAPFNFGQGSGASFNVTRTSGAYTIVLDPIVRYNEVQATTYAGLGQGATFNITRNGSTGQYTDVFISNTGSGYSATETITIAGASLGGVTPTNNLTITIQTVSGSGGIQAITHSGTASNFLPSAGNGYTAGEKIVIYGNTLGGISPANDASIFINTVNGIGGIATFSYIGQGISSTQEYNNVTGSSSLQGINSTFRVTRTGSGTKTAKVDQIVVGGTIETGDVFNISIDGGSVQTHSYTALAGDDILDVRNALITAINTTSTYVRASAGGTSGALFITARTPGNNYTTTISSFESDASAADSQTFTLTNFIPNEDTTTTPTYSAVITNSGSGYQPTETVTIPGASLGGETLTNDLVITVQSVNASGAIQSFTITGTAWNGNATFESISGNNTAFNATFLPKISGGLYAPEVASGGAGYSIGNQFKILGVSLGGTSPLNDMTITVNNVNYFTGAVTEISASGTPVSGDSIAFYPSLSLSAPVTAEIANGATLNYAAIARIRAQFTANHGLVPGNTILTAITSVGTNHSLAAGPFFVETVSSPTEFIYTARSTGTISTTPAIVGQIYARPDCFYTHRPFDGGVQLGTGTPAHGAQAIRQSKKYIRYQSGKGIMYTTGALFAPSYDLRSVTTSGTSIGSIITIITDDVDHGLQTGAEVQIDGILTSGYNGHYIVASIIDEITFTVIAEQVLESTTPVFGDQPIMALYKWKGATVRSGAFDDQNGIFFQYDGTNLSVGLRSSTFQLAGTVTATPNSNVVNGTNTKFTQQLAVGDRIVLRGMSHVVTSVTNDTRITVNPDYRGVNTVSNVKAALTRDIIIPQYEWNLDKVDGTGKSGYNIQINKMQMIGFQYSWYGAGFIDWMFRGPSGNFVFVHRLKNNNRNREAFMRSGNLPVRYEVINEGPKTRLTSNMSLSETDYMQVTDSSLFPNTGVVYIDNELIRYSTKNDSTNRLHALTRAANLSNYVAGANRTYTAGAPVVHTSGTGVILVNNTAIPQINHWGSAFLTDGGFDEDRGYLFNYQATEETISTTKATLFLIRLSPSVSNALTGDLGERELINRAQLLLKNVEVTSQGGTSSQGIIIEGVLNPTNYPIDPSNIEWFGLNNSGSGGQPSFAQVSRGSSVIWSGGGATINASNVFTQNFFSNYAVFNRVDVAQVFIGMQVSSTSAGLPGGTSVTAIQSIDSARVRIFFSQNGRAGSAGTSTFTFSVPPYAQPGERIFSFVATPGSRDSIDLSELKELTNTPIGGRGTFPNGPDVLAINAYITSGSTFKATINLRWGEAQA